MDLKAWASNVAVRGQRLAREGIAYMNRQLDAHNVPPNTTHQRSTKSSPFNDACDAFKKGNKKLEDFENLSHGKASTFSFLGAAKQLFEISGNNSTASYQTGEQDMGDKVMIRYQIHQCGNNTAEYELQLRGLPNNFCTQFEGEGGGGGVRGSAPDTCRSNHVFLVPHGKGETHIPLRDIKAKFPFDGKFWFRVKMLMVRDSPNSGVWVDVNHPDTLIPVYDGETEMRAMQVPEHADVSGCRDKEKKRIISFTEHLKNVDSPKVIRRSEGDVKSPRSGVDNGNAAINQLAHPPSVTGSPRAAADAFNKIGHDTTYVGTSNMFTDGAKSTSVFESLEENEINAKEGTIHDETFKNHSPPIDLFDAEETEGRKNVALPQTASKGGLSREQLCSMHETAKNERIKERLAHLKQMKEDEALNYESKLAVPDSVREQLKKWSSNPAGNWKDIRTLLSSLQEVLWKDCDWEPQTIGTLMNAAHLKAVHRKALLLCHPDRHHRANGEQQFRAQSIFEALNESFKMGSF